MSNILASSHIRHWKYQQWTQPVFTSDTTWGFLNASSVNSSYYAWRALDGVKPLGENYGNTWETGNSTTGWWRWVFARPLRIKGFTICGRAHPDTASTSYGFVIKDADGNGYEDASSFNAELNSEEINILAILMLNGWLQRQITSIENIRMKYSGTDFKMTS